MLTGCCTSRRTSASTAPPASRSCPVNAIFVEEDTPEEWKAWIPINYDFFKDEDATRAKVDELKPPA